MLRAVSVYLPTWPMDLWRRRERRSERPASAEPVGHAAYPRVGPGRVAGVIDGLACDAIGSVTLRWISAHEAGARCTTVRREITASAALRELERYARAPASLTTGLHGRVRSCWSSAITAGAS